MWSLFNVQCSVFLFNHLQIQQVYEAYWKNLLFDSSDILSLSEAKNK